MAIIIAKCNVIPYYCQLLLLYIVVAGHYYCCVSRENESPVINALDVRTNDDNDDDRATFAI